MSDAAAHLLERTLSEVFGQRGPARRAAAIAEIYTNDCLFHEAGEDIVGPNALHARIESILADAPGFMFRAEGRAEDVGDLGRLR